LFVNRPLLLLSAAFGACAESDVSADTTESSEIICTGFPEKTSSGHYEGHPDSITENTALNETAEILASLGDGVKSCHKYQDGRSNPNDPSKSATTIVSIQAETKSEAIKWLEENSCVNLNVENALDCSRLVVPCHGSNYEECAAWSAIPDSYSIQTSCRKDP
jgi:hypothetical protein